MNKPSEILDRWDAVSVVFGYKPEAWLRLIRIARHGSKGCTMSDLFPRTNGWRQLTTMRRAGIITVVDVPDSQNRKRSRIFISDKGLKLLRLQPEDKE